MNYLLYGIIATASILFILIILLIITLFKTKRAVSFESTERRCPTCGQVLEPEWNRCPFCATEIPKTYPTTETIPNLPPIGIFNYKIRC